MKRGWKVIRIGTRYSACAPSTGAIYYPTGVWVRPDKWCGPFALFQDQHTALQ